MENEPASLLVVLLGKALNKIPLSWCGILIGAARGEGLGGPLPPPFRSTGFKKYRTMDSPFKILFNLNFD